MKYLTVVLALLLLVLPACRRKSTPVVVHVFRDHNGVIGKNLDEAIRTIGLEQPRTADGSPIVIATFEFKDYREGLKTIGTTQRPDLVIFDSRADWLASNVGAAPVELACAPDVTCVAAIPSWMAGKDREASERVLGMISSKLRERPGDQGG